MTYINSLEKQEFLINWWFYFLANVRFSGQWKPWDVIIIIVMSLPAWNSRGNSESLCRFCQASADDQPAVSGVVQELQEVRDEVLATKEQLSNYKDSCSRLQEELQVCDSLAAFTLIVRVLQILFWDWSVCVSSRKRMLQ